MLACGLSGASVRLSAMNKRRGRRRFFKWAGLVCSLALSICWLVSVHFWVVVVVGKLHMHLLGGGAVLSLTSVWQGVDIVVIEDQSFPVEWLPASIPFTDSSKSGTFIPFWCPLTLVLIPTIALWRSDRRPLGTRCHATQPPPADP
jgi:hypothetical protein